VKYKKIIEDLFPNINWDCIRDINRALNWEIWVGPCGENYWTECDILENYTWTNVPVAIEDIKSMLDPIPSTIWIDDDCYSVSLNNPESDMDNWIDDEDRLPIWIGGDNWIEIDPRLEILNEKVYKLIYG